MVRFAPEQCTPRDGVKPVGAAALYDLVGLDDESWKPLGRQRRACVTRSDRSTNFGFGPDESRAVRCARASREQGEKERTAGEGHFAPSAAQLDRTRGASGERGLSRTKRVASARASSTRPSL